jgi:hypothetical protein
LTTPLAASPASFQPSNPAMATGEVSSPMSLNSMTGHLPKHARAVPTAYVVSLAHWVIDLRVRSWLGKLRLNLLRWV